MGDRQGVQDHHSLTPTQDRGGNPLTGSLPPLCVFVHRSPPRWRNRNHTLAASPDDRVTPTRVGKESGWHSPPDLCTRIIPTRVGRFGLWF